MLTAVTALTEWGLILVFLFQNSVPLPTGFRPHILPPKLQSKGTYAFTLIRAKVPPYVILPTVSIHES